MTFDKGLLFDHRKCPCCWDPAGGKGCGFADCMPLSFVSGGVAPDLDGEYETCVSNELPDWCEPSFEPVNGRMYATTVQVANGCGFVFAQYCRVNEMGNRGRSWVAEYWCSSAGTGSGTGTGTGTSDVKHLMFEGPDWECRCEGARFSGTFEGATAESYGCCADSEQPPVTTNCCGGAEIPATMVNTIGGCLNIAVTMRHRFITAVNAHVWEGSTKFQRASDGQWICLFQKLLCTAPPSTFMIVISSAEMVDADEECSTEWPDTQGGIPPTSTANSSSGNMTVQCSPFQMTGILASIGGTLHNIICPGSGLGLPFVLE